MSMAEDWTLVTMESSQTNPARKRPAKNEKLLLDDYIHFLHSRQSIHLTMNQLNQVPRIHGFKKIHHSPKKVLVDAVDSLDLVELQRSTLSQNVSAFAVLTVEDVVADLAELSWQECCVTSLEKLSSSSNINNDNDNHSLFLFPASSSDHHSILQLTNHSHSQFSQKRRIEEVSAGHTPEAVRSSLRAAKMVPRRKRSSFNAPPAVYAASTTVDSASLASC